MIERFYPARAWGYVIRAGVYMFVDKKIFELYFSDRLTFAVGLLVEFID